MPGKNSAGFYHDLTHQGGNPAGQAKVTKAALAAREAEDKKHGDPGHKHFTDLVRQGVKDKAQMHAASQPGQVGEDARRALAAKPVAQPMQANRTVPGAMPAIPEKKRRR